MLLFCDMDEVLTDFIGGANKVLLKCGQPEWSAWDENDPTTEDRRWSYIKTEPKFWHNLEFREDGKKLWEYIKQFKPIILSSVTSYMETECREGKRYWLVKNLGYCDEKRICLVRRSQKADFATNHNMDTPNVLIDDYDKNCSEFRKAGGIAIQHKSAEETINRLKMVMLANPRLYLASTVKAA